MGLTSSVPSGYLPMLDEQQNALSCLDPMTMEVGEVNGASEP